VLTLNHVVCIRILVRSIYRLQRWQQCNERLNDPGHSILVRKSYNFARYLSLTFTDLENIANLLFKNYNNTCVYNKKQYNKRPFLCSKLIYTGVPELARQLLTVNFIFNPTRILQQT
jgi:hypothetical protein